MPMAAGGDEAQRAFAAMMPMKKIDIATLEAARRGTVRHDGSVDGQRRHCCRRPRSGGGLRLAHFKAGGRMDVATQVVELMCV